MKYLLLLAVIVAAVWWAFGRRAAPPAVGKPGARKAAEPQTMLECAHCGVHLPRTDALADADGRPFCSEAHRLAGPR